VVLLRGNQVVHTLALGFVPTVLLFSLDGATLVVGGKDKKLHLYDVGKDTLKASAPATIDTHDKPLTALRFSPDGQWLASTDQEASVYIHAWPAGAVQNKSGWRFHQAAVKDVDWAPDSARLVTSSQDTHLIVWRDMKEFNGSERARAKDAHVDGANFVRFWDENTLVSVGADRSVKIWNAAE
jgi:WD40 repeat protein